MADTNQKTQQAAEVIKEVASKRQQEKEVVVKMEQLVTFSLDQEEYAAIITDLREIIRIPEIVPIPGAPNFIRGILNLRGTLVVVVDLEKRVGLSRDHPMKPKHIIIVEIGETIFGIVVDEVSGVLRVPASTIRPTPALVSAKISTDFLKGVVILEQDHEEKEGEKGKQQDEQAQTQKAEKLKSQKKENAEERSAPGVTDESALPAETAELKGQRSKGSRLILLLDLPKLLAEKELIEFGKAVVETAGEGLNE
jgi:purine-binding chemotaxis protein CheW